LASFDVNANGIPDECDIGSGHSQDVNGNHIPDECEGGQNAMAPTGSGFKGTGPSDDSAVSDDDSAGGVGEMNTAQQNTGESRVPQDQDTAREEFYEWAWDRCWGPDCLQSVVEQFQEYVDKLEELGLPVVGPQTPP